MSFRVQICSDRASILLETALCIPFYFVLLVFLVDVPQIMAHRQNLLGVARLDADIKAHNRGDASMIDETRYINLFWADTKKVTRLEHINQDLSRDSFLNRIFTNAGEASISDSLESSTAASEAFRILSVARRIVVRIINFISGGAEKHFIRRVFDTDVYYASQPRVAIKTLLPAEFYAVAMNLEVQDSFFVECPAKCWQPSGNSAQRVGLTLFGSIGRMINTALSWLRFFVPIPSFNPDPEA